MQVFDMLNEKWYEKKDLIKESYEVFLEDYKRDPDCLKPKVVAMELAKEYVKENSISKQQYPEWKKRNQ